ncbi:MAG: phosphatidylserine decarboxylase family protein [Ignavibacteriae bacterium]|jgi:phosphatidylserine decarboxylase|nr:phosphatidylserine decarboxylase family protein [Ignavibacteriota bacterium]
MLTKYGYDNAIPMLIIGFSLILLSGFVLQNAWSWISAILGIIIILFTLWFFRDPQRIIPSSAISDPSIIIAPADGKIVEIIEMEEKEFFKGKARQISIFLSPLDVHVNRSPVSGTVEFYRYMQGDYMVAWHPKASELNEQSRIGVQNEFGKVFFKQITGVLARRIVCTVKQGDVLETGEQIGMMKFGSRMDIILPLDAEILVHKDERTRGGETIIARLKK